MKPEIKEKITATDNYDGDLTDKVSVTGAVDTSKPGDYEIKYSVSTANSILHLVLSSVILF